MVDKLSAYLILSDYSLLTYVAILTAAALQERLEDILCSLLNPVDYDSCFFVTQP